VTLDQVVKRVNGVKAPKSEGSSTSSKQQGHHATLLPDEVFVDLVLNLQEETVASGSGPRRSEEEQDYMVRPEQCTDVSVLYETNQGTQLFGVRYLCRSDEEAAYNPIDLTIRENPKSGMHGNLLKDALAALGTIRTAM
jgi:hypothetical protein